MKTRTKLISLLTINMEMEAEEILENTCEVSA